MCVKCVKRVAGCQTRSSRSPLVADLQAAVQQVWSRGMAQLLRSSLSGLALTRLRLHDCVCNDGHMQGLAALLGVLPHLQVGLPLLVRV